MLIKETKQMTESEKIAVRNSNNQYLKALAYAPVGMIIPFGGSVAPDTFLFCDGAELNVDEYTDLFNVIGHSYGGSGDTFKLPDLRGKTIVGIEKADEDFNTLGKIGGEKSHTHALDSAYAKIGQSITGNTGALAWKSVEVGGYGEKTNMMTYESVGVVPTESQVNSTELGGETNTANNISPYIVINFLIKAVNADSNEIGGLVGNNDYETLENKPSINGVKLVGNKTTSELGINMPNMENYYTKDETDKEIDVKADKEYVDGLVGNIETLLGGI